MQVDLLTTQGVSLKRYDVAGSDAFELSLSEISAGIYIVKIYTQQGEVIKKLIVKK